MMSPSITLPLSPSHLSLSLSYLILFLPLSYLSLPPFPTLLSLSSLSHLLRGDHSETYMQMRLSDLGQFEAAATEDGATSDQEETSRLTDTEDKSEPK